MKHLKSLLLKLKAKKTLKTYQRPLLVTIITLLVINFIRLFVGSLIAVIIDNNLYNQENFNGKYLEAFVTSIKWMISPNTIMNYKTHENLELLILAVVIVVIEMVLFSGAIVAMVTTSLRNFIDKKSKAKGKILVNNHFVILNWNSKVPDMIYNLMLKGYKDSIIILSNQNKEYIENEIKSLMLTYDINTKAKANLIIKEGDSLLRSNLEDISIDKAKYITIMARDDMYDGDDDNIINSDLLNLKIVLRLGSFDLLPDAQIVVETDSNVTRGQIENLAYTVASLKNKNIIPVSFNKKIGQIIAQSIVCPEMSQIYLKLFSFEGAEFYSVDSNENIEEYMSKHNDAIAVAKLHKLFILADNKKDNLLVRENPIKITKKLEEKEPVKESKFTIFMIGDNSKKEYILDNLNRSMETSMLEFELKTYHKNDNDKLINDIKETEGEKKVLILSDDNVGAESYDANVFVTLIELSKTFPKRDKLTFITELLDSRNLSSVQDFNIKNTIISNKMMSLLITQLVMNEDSKKFFEKILTTDSSDSTGDFDIVVTKVSNLVKIEKELVFESNAELLHAFYNTFEGKNILIGIIKNNEYIFLNKNQDKKENIILKPEDSFIYFKY